MEKQNGKLWKSRTGKYVKVHHVKLFKVQKRNYNVKSINVKLCKLLKRGSSLKVHMGIYVEV